MTPLLFISVVTLVLIVMIYWILSSLEKRSPEEDHEARERIRFESSPELFDFPDPNTVAEQDVLRIQAHKDSLQLYWQVSSTTWENTMQKLGLDNKKKAIVIRVFNSTAQAMDFPVNDIQGGQQVKTGSFQASYAVLGVKITDKFVPLFLSRQI